MQVDNFEQFISSLSGAIQSPPGMDAYELMMPEIRKRFKNLDVSKIEGAKLSSVLMLLYHDNGKVYLPLTKRHDYKGTHGGQISLPGGKHEEGDDSRIATALREAEEEVGVAKNTIEVVGTLSEIYIPPSNFKVLPVVGIHSGKPNFVREEFEVEEIIEAELYDFLDHGNRKSKDIEVRGGVLRDVPYFEIQGHVVWGATAMMMSELIYILENID